MAGAGYYHALPDNDADIVSYSTVNSLTNGYPNKHFFVCTWVCYSADDTSFSPNVNAAAQAWTQHSNLASDGYNYPDTSGDCFIGFDLMSPGLEWSIYKDSTVTGQTFIEYFYAYATAGYTVRNALNQASLDLFGTSFTLTPLVDTFESWFPGGTFNGVTFEAKYYNCTMKIYGDSNIYLTQYYANTYISKTAYNNGAANNPTYMLGSTPDGLYTQLYGGDRYDGGMVVSKVATDYSGSGSGYAYGHIYLQGYSVSGYYSHLYVYVSQMNNNDWQLVNSFTVYPSPYSVWIDVGNAPYGFKYIAVAGYDDAGLSANLMIDCVRVIP